MPASHYKGVRMCENIYNLEFIQCGNSSSKAILPKLLTINALSYLKDHFCKLPICTWKYILHTAQLVSTSYPRYICIPYAICD